MGIQFNYCSIHLLRYPAGAFCFYCRDGVHAFPNKQARKAYEKRKKAEYEENKLTMQIPLEDLRNNYRVMEHGLPPVERE